MLWHINLSGSTQDLIVLQQQLAKQVREGLLPMLGAEGGFVDTGTQPKNQEAYDLYLRSVAVPHGPGANKQAIEMLERAVGMDPSYAPPWEELGLRYYYDATDSNGGEDIFQRSNNSYERALALDPNRMVAAGQLINNRVERGELAKAYSQAQELVRRRPESAQAHFTLAYVLRYAGLLEEATRQCDKALEIDPGDYLFRSCAWAFLELGEIEQATKFLRLDAGSEWAGFVSLNSLLREGKLNDARQAVKKVPLNPRDHQDLLEVCLQPHPGAQLDKVAAKTEAAVMAENNPETWYQHGAILAYCGKT
jgi:tetratricopeptide (TPR) repeat protein